MHRSILPFALALLGFAPAASASPGGADTTSASRRVESACAGISAADRERPLFGDRLEVLHSRAIRPSGGKAVETRAMGAEVFVRAEPGLTARYVHRLAACQVAMYEAELATSSDDPLAVSGVEIHVRESGPGFVVRISTDRRSTASAVIARAAALPGRTVARATTDSNAL